MEFLYRHASGDWGDLEAADKQHNDEALMQGLPIASVYTLTTGVKIRIVTKADRRATTVLLAEDP